MKAGRFRPNVVWIPLAWAAVLTCLFAIPFSTIPWNFGDMYTVLEKADSLGWRETLVDAFARDVEYRPFFTLLVKGLYDLAGLHLWFYKALVLLQYAAILWIFTWILRPRKTTDVIAALLGMSCVVGLHTSTILFSYFPVNHHSLVMLLVLLAAALALDPRGRQLEWLFALITLVALFLIEFGLLIPPILTVLFFVRADGVTRRSVAASWIALGLYIAIRLSLTTQVGFPVAHSETGLGFSMVERDELNRIFARTPWLFWGYNVAVGFLTVMFSEPRSGMFYFVNSLRHGNTQPWLWLHVLSSTLTTLLIGGVLLGGLLSSASPSSRDRQLIWLGGSLLLLSSGLGFLYARDRISLPGGVGYGILLYVAAARVLDGTAGRSLSRMAVTALLVAMFATWLVRDVEAWFQIRDTAWERHVEWTERYEELGGLREPQEGLLMRLRSAGLATTPDDPQRDPAWTFLWFERRVSPP